ncbi:MAG: methyl-accepting chemotaxis protein [Brevinematales bacterium]|nr:methyl-accepting chemotaxis protein [Brevinematales bacterium]
MSKRFNYPKELNVQFLLSIFLFSFVFLAGGGAILYFIWSSPSTSSVPVALFILFISASVVYLIFGILRDRNVNRKYLLESRNRMLTSFYTVHSVMNLIINLFMLLEKVRLPGEDSFVDVKFEKLRSNIYKIKETLLSFAEYEEMLAHPETVNEELIEKGLKEINSTFYSINENIIAAMNDFVEAFFGKRENIKKSSSSMATLIYFLANIIPIISDLSSSSNRFSREVILQVIAQFEEIASFSNRITDDIQVTMSDLMNENNEDSLAFIIKRAHSVVEDFDTFYKSMDSLKDVSNHFVDTSVDKLKNISDIANSIEEIAETIKVISLNVSIEAANTGNIGKGFQVLARDLRQFAHTTMQFAQDVKNRVQETMLTTENLKTGYLQNMESVYRYGDEIKQSIESFERIIIKSFDKIRGIIDTLRGFSSRIDTGIKDVVGKLQYYDITSQEVEHLSQFIEQIFKISSSRIDEFQIDKILGNDSRLSIKKEILDTVNNIITTKNEREIYDTYTKIFGMRSEEINIDNKVGDDLGVNLSDQTVPGTSNADDIIIF